MGTRTRGDARGNAEMTARRLRVFEATCQGRTVQEIAAALSTPESTIYRDIQANTAKMTLWASERVNSALAFALSQFERAMTEAWAAYANAREIQQKWLDGDYDREEYLPDADGGSRLVRKPPILRVEIAALLGKAIEATKEYAKLAGLDKAVALENLPDELLLERARKAGISPTRRTS